MRDDAIEITDREEVEALRYMNDDLRERLDDRRGRSRAEAAAAFCFAVAASAGAIALGAGGLGVVFVAGCVGGIYSLVCASKSSL